MFKYIIMFLLSGVLSVTETAISQPPQITIDTRPVAQVYEVSLEPTEYDIEVLRYLYNQNNDNKLTAEDRATLKELKEKYGAESVNRVFKSFDKEYKKFFEKEAKSKPVQPQEDQQSQEDLLSLISYSEDSSLNSLLVSTMAQAPERIISSVINLGYHIEIVSDPGEEYGFKYVCGLTVPDEKKILIQSKESKFRKSVVHEMSHVFDEYNNWVSETKEFKEIFNQEKDSFKVHDYSSTHYLDNTKEYFAEACQEYTYHPDALKANAPKTYEFIKSLM